MKNQVNAAKNSAIPSTESKATRTLNAAPSFTAGPWNADMHGQNVLACDDQMMICNVRGWGYLTGVGGLNLPDDEAIEIQDANTRLIAAAPALYAALKAVLDAASINGTYGIPATKGRALLLDRGEEAQARAALNLVDSKN